MHEEVEKGRLAEVKNGIRTGTRTLDRQVTSVGHLPLL